MNPRIFAAAPVALSAAIAVDASAQELNLYNASAERPNIVSAKTGVDHGLVADFGYARVIESGRRRFFLGGDFEMLGGGADLDDFRLRANVATSLIGNTGDHWHLVLALSPTLRQTTNAAAHMTGLGVDTRLTGGWYARHGFVGLDVGLDWTATTHIANSDAYRMVYADAKDGWYGSPGGTIYASLLGGVSFGGWDLVLRAGAPRALDLSGQTLPLFATAGLNYALPF